MFSHLKYNRNFGEIVSPVEEDADGVDAIRSSVLLVSRGVTCTWLRILSYAFWTDWAVRGIVLAMSAMLAVGDAND